MFPSLTWKMNDFFESHGSNDVFLMSFLGNPCIDFSMSSFVLSIVHFDSICTKFSFKILKNSSLLDGSIIGKNFPTLFVYFKQIKQIFPSSFSFYFSKSSTHFLVIVSSWFFYVTHFLHHLLMCLSIKCCEQISMTNLKSHPSISTLVKTTNEWNI